MTQAYHWLTQYASHAFDCTRHFDSKMKRTEKKARGLDKGLNRQSQITQKLEKSPSRVLKKQQNPNESCVSKRIKSTSKTVDCPTKSSPTSHPTAVSDGRSLPSYTSKATCPRTNHPSLFKSRYSREEHSKLLGRQLIKAVEEGKRQFIRILLDIAGADVNSVAGNKWTTLHRAARKGDLKLVSLLLRRGANANAQTGQGYTALHLAAQHDRTGRCIDMLLKAGCSVDTWNEFGRTALHYAAESANEAAVRVLLKAGACKHVIDNRMKTPYDMSKDAGIRRLLQY